MSSINLPSESLSPEARRNSNAAPIMMELTHSASQTELLKFNKMFRTLRLDPKLKRSPWWWHVTSFGKFLFLCAFFFCCICFYGANEHWDIRDSINFVIVTISTVGFGYRYPTNDASRCFTIFVMLFGVFFVFSSLQEFLSKQLHALKDMLHTAEDKKYLTPEEAYADLAKYRRRFAVMMITLTALTLLAATFYKYSEDWSFLTGLYYAIETSTTIGYGDLKIKHRGTHTFTNVYIITMCTFTVFAVSYLQSLNTERNQLNMLEEELIVQENLDVSRSFDDKPPSEMEFTLTMLIKLGKVRAIDIEFWKKKYAVLKERVGGDDDVRPAIPQFMEELREGATIRHNNLIARDAQQEPIVETIKGIYDESLLMVESSTIEIVRRMTLTSEEPPVLGEHWPTGSSPSHGDSAAAHSRSAELRSRSGSTMSPLHSISEEGGERVAD